MTSLSSILSEQAAQITPQGTPVLHSDKVYCATFSPDGRYLVSGSVNRQVNVWEVGTTELSDYMKGHTKFVWSLAFSPDSKTLASASGDGTVFLWDIESRSHYRIEESHYAIILPLYGVAFSPQGDYFAAGCADGVVRLWSTASKRPPWKLKGHKNEIYSVDFSPDGRFLASGGNDFTVRIWNVEDKCENEIMTRHGCRVTSVKYSPDGRFLAYASTDTRIYIINLASGESQILSCHQDITVTIPGYNETSSQKWNRQGKMTNHSIGMEYSRVAMRNTSRYRYRYPLTHNDRIRLFDGKVGCGSCHSLYSQEKAHLVQSNYGSALCFECHDM